MANYNRDFNPSKSIASSPSSLSSSSPSSPRVTSASQSSSSSVHASAAATAVPISSAASVGAANIVKSPQDTAPGAEHAIDLHDWKVHLQPDSRQRIVNKMAETVRRYLLFSGEEGLLEIKKIAAKFEEEIYDAATSRTDYLRKISLKMLKMDMETTAQDDVAISVQSNSTVCSNELQLQENLMDSSKSRYTAPGGELDIDMRDWRVHVKHEGRQRIVNKITETLNRYLPLSSDEGLLELKNIATRFEEKIYVSATTQSDYLRKISLKILTLEKKAEK